MTSVAILGAGRMGTALARRLFATGHQLVIYNRSPESARVLADEIGAMVAGRPADAVDAADIVLSSLADDSAVEAVFRGSGGALDGVRAGTVVLEMSTVSPALSQALEPDVTARGGALLDAPVSGSVALIEQGRLTVMVGGDAATLERARPVLDDIAGRVFHMGGVGSGASMKLAVNSVVFALCAALSEALVLAERAGIDPARAYDVFEASAVGAPVVAYKRRHFLEPELAPLGFPLSGAAKDMRLVERLAESVGLSAAHARFTLEIIEAAAASQGGAMDFAAIAAHLRQADGAGTAEVT